jgi:hypothetical protein
MNKFQKILDIVGLIVKWVGVIMVVSETVEFGYKRLKEKFAEMDVKPEKIKENGEELPE